MKNERNAKKMFGRLFPIRGRVNNEDIQPMEKLVSGAWRFIYASLYKDHQLPPDEIEESRQLLRRFFLNNSRNTKAAFLHIAENTIYYCAWLREFPTLVQFSPVDLLATENPSGLHYAHTLALPWLFQENGENYPHAIRALCKAAYWQARDEKAFRSWDWKRLLLHYGYIDLYELFLCFLAYCQNDFTVASPFPSYTIIVK